MYKLIILILIFSSTAVIGLEYWPLNPGNEWICKYYNQLFRISVLKQDSLKPDFYLLAFGVFNAKYSRDIVDNFALQRWVNVESDFKITFVYREPYTNGFIDYNEEILVDFSDKTQIQATNVTVINPIGTFENCILFKDWRIFAPNLGPIRNLIYAKVNGIEYGQKPTPVEIVKEQTHPSAFRLYQNHPNPFSARGGSAFGGNGSTEIQFELEEPSEVTLSVYDLQGRMIKLLTQSNYQAGHHRFTWNGTNNHCQNVSSGLYFIKLKVNGFEQVVKALYTQ